MKVNPVAIQTYQQLVQQQPRQAETEPQADRAGRPAVESPRDTATLSAGTSRLAVKGPSGTYADYLTPEEKEALDVLFSRYRGNRFARTDSADSPAEPPALGQVIDIKV